MIQILNYGGGRQTSAICILIKNGKLPRPDRICIADTGREKQSTWDYLNTTIQPMLSAIGITVEIAPRSLAYVDLYSHQGDFLMPLYTATGKLSAFCSTEWKARVIDRYLSEKGVKPADKTNWIGFAWDERKRIKGVDNRSFPLCDLMLTKADCMEIIRREGLPVPPPSSCYMCPNMPNAEWRYIRDTYPDQFQEAIRIDEELREEDLFRGGSGVWVHHSRLPLAQADLEAEDMIEPTRQCGLGLCFV